MFVHVVVVNTHILNAIFSHNDNDGWWIQAKGFSHVTYYISNLALKWRKENAEWKKKVKPPHHHHHRRHRSSLKLRNTNVRLWFRWIQRNQTRITTTTTCIAGVCHLPRSNYFDFAMLSSLVLGDDFHSVLWIHGWKKREILSIFDFWNIIFLFFSHRLKRLNGVPTDIFIADIVRKKRLSRRRTKLELWIYELKMSISSRSNNYYIAFYSGALSGRCAVPSILFGQKL